MVFRLFFALTAFFNLNIDQIDMRIVFLYNLIDQIIYMEISKGTDT